MSLLIKTAVQYYFRFLIFYFLENGTLVQLQFQDNVPNSSCCVKHECCVTMRSEREAMPPIKLCLLLKRDKSLLILSFTELFSVPKVSVDYCRVALHRSLLCCTLSCSKDPTTTIGFLTFCSNAFLKKIALSFLQ